MSRNYWTVWTCVVACGLALGICGETRAATIIKLGLGSDATADIEYDAGDMELRTIDDGDGATDGHQNTRVEYLSFLQGVFPDITTPIASLTLSGLAPSGAPDVLGGVVVTQFFSGGNITLYDDNNDELLIGTLGDSFLVGPIGPPGTGAVFTLTASSAVVTGGSVLPHLIPDTLALSLSFTDVNNGAGFSVSGAMNQTLNSFDADVTLNISAEQIPEPASVLLVVLAALLTTLAARRRCIARPEP